MANVTAIAAAPPPTNRTTARVLDDLPNAALTAPVIVSPISTPAKATGMRQPSGGSRIASRGSSEPNVKDTKDENAAAHGLVT